MAAGPNIVRRSGPNRSHAFEDALTLAGSPGPRIDRICITSSCPRQFGRLQNDLCGSWRQSRLFKALIAHHDGPSDPRHLVDERNSRDLGRPSPIRGASHGWAAVLKKAALRFSSPDERGPVAQMKPESKGSEEPLTPQPHCFSPAAFDFARTAPAPSGVRAGRGAGATADNSESAQRRRPDR